MTRPSRKLPEQGFTLVEVMVSLMIFGMLAAAGVAILAFSVRAQGAAGARLDDAGALNRAASILSADLAQALTRPTRDEAGTLLPPFVGEATTLSVVRGGWSNIDAAPRPSAQKVAYRLGDATFERVAWPMLDGAAPLDPAVLVDKVRTIRLRYRYRGAWSERWDGAGGVPLPDAVELVLVRDTGVIWRQMFVAGAGYAGQPTITVSADAPS